MAMLGRGIEKSGMVLHPCQVSSLPLPLALLRDCEAEAALVCMAGSLGGLSQTS